jgi:hypothetical protein
MSPVDVPVQYNRTFKSFSSRIMQFMDQYNRVVDDPRKLEEQVRISYSMFEEVNEMFDYLYEKIQDGKLDWNLDRTVKSLVRMIEAILEKSAAFMYNHYGTTYKNIADRELVEKHRRELEIAYYMSGELLKLIPKSFLEEYVNPVSNKYNRRIVKSLERKVDNNLNFETLVSDDDDYVI